MPTIPQAGRGHSEIQFDTRDTMQFLGIRTNSLCVTELDGGVFFRARRGLVSETPRTLGLGFVSVKAGCLKNYAV